MTGDALVAGLPLGSRTRSPARTIGEGDFALLNTLTWSISEIHTNQIYMSETSYGDRLLAGPILIAVVAGLHAVSDGFRALRDDHGIVFLATVGLSARYRNPVVSGDTIYVDTRLVSARPLSNCPGRGEVVFKDAAFNQNEDIVIETERILMFARTAAEVSVAK